MEKKMFELEAFIGVTIAAVAAVIVLIVHAMFLNVINQHQHHEQQQNKKDLDSKTKDNDFLGTDNTFFNPFDSLAETYDTHFCDTSVGSILRRQTWEALKEAFLVDDQIINKDRTCYVCEPDGLSWISSELPMPTRNPIILELCCGTGEDSIWLASKRHIHVVATDYSEGMLQKARSKLKNYPNHHQPSIILENYCQPYFQTLDLRTFHTDDTLLSSLLEPNTPSPQFAGVFSNFGGLNNVGPDCIKNIAERLAKIVKPNGKVVLVIMGRFCLLETLYYLFTLQFRRAFRRIQSCPHNGILVKVGNNKSHRLYFHSMQFIEDTFNATSAFRTCQKRAIGFTLPPSLWSKSASRKIPIIVLEILGVVDRLLGSLWPFLYKGDQYLIEFEHVGVVGDDMKEQTH